MQTPAEHARLLSRVPPTAYAVKVTQPDGKCRYKRPSEVEDDDEIHADKDGEPIVMMGKPGRRRKKELHPSDHRIAEVIEARQDFIATAPLVRAVQKDPDADDVIENVLQGMAAEAAALEFERKEAERLGEDSTAISVSRGRILKAMADIWIKRHALSSDGAIDLNGKAAAVLIEFVLETVREAMEDVGLRDEAVESVFVKLAKRLDDGWKQEAAARMKSK